MKKGIFGVIVLILLGVGGFFGYKYYSETYKTTTAYTKIPAEVPEKTKSKRSRQKSRRRRQPVHSLPCWMKPFLHP